MVNPSKQSLSLGPDFNMGKQSKLLVNKDISVTRLYETCRIASVKMHAIIVSENPQHNRIVTQEHLLHLLLAGSVVKLQLWPKRTYAIRLIMADCSIPTILHSCFALMGSSVIVNCFNYKVVQSGAQKIQEGQVPTDEQIQTAIIAVRCLIGVPMSVFPRPRDTDTLDPQLTYLDVSYGGKSNNDAINESDVMFVQCTSEFEVSDVRSIVVATMLGVRSPHIVAYDQTAPFTVPLNMSIGQFIFQFVINSTTKANVNTDSSTYSNDSVAHLPDGKFRGKGKKQKAKIKSNVEANIDKEQE